MGLGAWLHVTEWHEHEHLHEPMRMSMTNIINTSIDRMTQWGSRTPIGMSTVA